LPVCLESVRGLFDEIVVIDTGSHDRTVEIVRLFGANVFDVAWVDDFAAARNEALARATGDYAFWLDADDVVDPSQQEKLRALLHGLCPGDEAGYVVRCACDLSPDGTGGETVVDHIRLFPLRPGVRWTYRVHEQILPSLRQAKIPVRWTDLTVRHTGYVDKELRAKNLDRDTRILKRELDERLDDPFVCFNLGAIAIERQQWHEAFGFLTRSLDASAPSDSIVRKLSDPQLVEPSGQHALNHVGSATIGLVVAADRVSHVAAAGIQQECAGLDFGHGAEQVVEMVGRHGEDTIGLADEARRDPAAAMVFERTSESADHVDGMGGGRYAIGGCHAGGPHHESAAIEFVERATQAFGQQQFTDGFRHGTAAGVPRTHEEDDDARSFRESGRVDNSLPLDTPAILVDAHYRGEVLIMRGSGVDDHVQPGQTPE
jgi:Glycosyl transferase family 2